MKQALQLTPQLRLSPLVSLLSGSLQPPDCRAAVCRLGNDTHLKSSASQLRQ